MNDETRTETGEATVAEPQTDAAEAKPKAKRTANRMTEEELLLDYPHVRPGTLTFLALENKQAVTIACQHVKEDGEVCGRERQVRTSDLWQVNKCHACTRKARREAAKARRAKKKAAEAAEAEGS